MAIARGTGTEIIRSAWFEIVDSTVSILIFGVQHHIYTVLNLNVYCVSKTGTDHLFYLRQVGYDFTTGSGGGDIRILNQDIAALETFNFDDKFAFTGVHPTDWSGAMDGVDDQDAAADQGGSTATRLECYTTHAGDSYNVSITYLDQNNA
mgnify:CR=1 FL=1